MDICWSIGVSMKLKASYIYIFLLKQAAKLEMKNTGQTKQVSPCVVQPQCVGSAAAVFHICTRRRQQ